MQAIPKSPSLFRTLTQSVFDPHAADFWLQKVNPIWSTSRALAQIIEKKQVAKDTISLTLQTNRHVKVGQAGQHHPVKVKINGRLYERSYSLTEREGHLILTVKKIADGKVSTWLHEQSQIGDLVEIGQPFGDMQLSNQPNIILLAAGSGITPMYSLIEQLKRNQQLTQSHVKLLYWVKHRDEAAFASEFEQLTVQYPQFDLKIFTTQDTQHDDRLNVTHLAAIENLENTTVYACGPSGFVQTAEELFGHAQVFMSEAFSLTRIADNDTGFINVTLSRSNKTVAIPKGQSILAGLEQANVKPTYGCRMGVCHKCVCQKTEGTTKDLLNASENSEPKNFIKICVSSAKSDLVIDL
ncbi:MULTISPECIES: ferredoxin reductase [unclassified Acinetobacter]|uniref:ferredoxin reductase n=1 Tax=unclassified Acinetobacter TaxID=196816 RepID=UPI00190A2863|nr:MULTISPECIES: ferredoxin reductase [unclassified Acinetobacter]MBK0062313.1 ferredoxin reductase [Acinetobacter sp. S55]MBK0066117.1 ferredoxin reductase [Acinetobacter sp. S54]